MGALGIDPLHCVNEMSVLVNTVELGCACTQARRVVRGRRARWCWGRKRWGRRHSIGGRRRRILPTRSVVHHVQSHLQARRTIILTSIKPTCLYTMHHKISESWESCLVPPRRICWFGILVSLTLQAGCFLKNRTDTKSVCCGGLQLFESHLSKHGK